MSRRLSSSFRLKDPREVIEEKSSEHGQDADPLSVLVDIYLDADMPITARLDAAKAAAQYVHPKRSSIDVTSEGDRPQLHIDNLHQLILLRPELLEHVQALALGTSTPVIEPRTVEATSEPLDEDETTLDEES